MSLHDRVLWALTKTTWATATAAFWMAATSVNQGVRP
jgi:hypothetical protein